MRAVWNIHVAALAVTAQSTLPSCTELGFLDTREPVARLRARAGERAGDGPAFYLHIAKCAGTSVAVHLSALLDDPPAASARAQRAASAPRPLADAPAGLRYVWVEGLQALDAADARRVLAADVVSIERDAAWRDPRGRAPRARYVMLRAPTCRAQSHFEHHRAKRRIHQAHRNLDEFLRECCLARGAAPDAARCKVECRQFFNLQTFMLVGNAGDRFAGARGGDDPARDHRCAGRAPRLSPRRRAGRG